MTKSSNPLRYADAGVDIQAGNNLVKNISPFAKATNRAGVIGGLGGFGSLFDLKAAGFNDPILVSGTDGVGTKLKIAIDCNMHDTIGIDLVAMCVNDILVQGAKPLFFLDYFATGKLHVDTATKVIASIAEGCKRAGAALVGGETAEMPDFYDADHYDLAGFCVGAAERSQLLPKNNIQEGDIILGLPSSGFHSNGYSLVRKICEKENISYDMPCEWDNSKTFGEALLTPTIIYVKMLENYLNEIKALCHITGGGLTENLPRILPSNLTCYINLNSWALPPCFAWAKHNANLEDKDMLETFNCGIGMVIITDKNSDIKNSLKHNAIEFYEIGTIIQKQEQAVIYNGSL